MAAVKELPPAELAALPAEEKRNPNGIEVGIASVGVASSIGIGVDNFWTNLVNGANGMQEIDPDKIPAFRHFQGQVQAHILGLVEGFRGHEQQLLVDTDIIRPGELRYLSEAVRLELVATHEALTNVKKTDGTPANLVHLVEDTDEESGEIVKHWEINSEVVDPERVIHIGATGMGGAAEGIIASYRRMDKKDARGKGGLPLAKDIFVSLPGQVGARPAMAYGIHGGQSMTSNECASGNKALEEGMDLIRLDKADVVVVSAVESPMDPVPMSNFGSLQAITPAKDPNRYPKVLDDGRNGFGWAEGSGTIVLINREFAKKKGINVDVLLAGTGSSSDSYHRSSPRPDGYGAVLAMMRAVRDAGGFNNLITKGRGAWDLHATGTLADPIEAGAVTYLLGGFADYLEGALATKPSHGHPMGASGLIEAIVLYLALMKQTLPPTIKIERPMKEAAHLKPVHNEARPAKDMAWGGNNSFGFGGGNNVNVLVRADA